MTFAVMINSSFTPWPAKYARKNIQEKQSIDLNYAGITTSKVIQNP